MKINVNRSTDKPKRLPTNQYSSLAKYLITTHLNSKSELTDKKFNELKATIDGFRNGEPTAKGYQVYVKFLMGAMNRISPELVDRLSASVEPEAEAESEYF